MHIFCFAFLIQAKYDITAISQGRHIAKTHIWSKKPYTIFMYYYNPYMYLHSCEIAHYLLYSNCSIKWFIDDASKPLFPAQSHKNRPILYFPRLIIQCTIQHKHQNNLWMVPDASCPIYLHFPKEIHKKWQRRSWFCKTFNKEIMSC